VTAKPKTNDIVGTPQLPASALEDISDLDNLNLQACVELIRLLFTAILVLLQGLLVHSLS
jgi:hypothetical protein